MLSKWPQIHTRALSSHCGSQMWWKASRSMIYYTHKRKVSHTNTRGWDCDICLTICWGRIVFGARDTHNSLVNAATEILRFLCFFYSSVCQNSSVMRIREHTNAIHIYMNVIPFVKSSTNTYNVTKTIELWFGIYLALVYFVLPFRFIEEIGERFSTIFYGCFQWIAKVIDIEITWPNFRGFRIQWAEGN